MMMKLQIVSLIAIGASADFTIPAYGGWSMASQNNIWASENTGFAGKTVLLPGRFQKEDYNWPTEAWMMKKDACKTAKEGDDCFLTFGGQNVACDAWTDGAATAKKMKKMLGQMDPQPNGMVFDIEGAGCFPQNIGNPKDDAKLKAFVALTKAVKAEFGADFKIGITTPGDQQMGGNNYKTWGVTTDGEVPYPRNAFPDVDFIMPMLYAGGASYIKSGTWVPEMIYRRAQYYINGAKADKSDAWTAKNIYMTFQSASLQTPTIKADAAFQTQMAECLLALSQDTLGLSGWAMTKTPDLEANAQLFKKVAAGMEAKFAGLTGDALAKKACGVSDSVQSIVTKRPVIV